jgi:hypothetical protein
MGGFVHTAEVTGSIPVAPTLKSLVRRPVHRSHAAGRPWLPLFCSHAPSSRGDWQPSRLVVLKLEQVEVRSERLP